MKKSYIVLKKDVSIFFKFINKNELSVFNTLTSDQKHYKYIVHTQPDKFTTYCYYMTFDIKNNICTRCKTRKCNLLDFKKVLRQSKLERILK